MSLKKISVLRRGLLISAILALASACRPVRILNAVIPTQSMHIVRDIPFGSSPRQSLDIYQPAQMPAKLLPVILFFYGGSWDSGSKRDYLFVAEALVSQGFVVVIADYRIYPEVKFPQLMDDPALSVQWVKKHIASYGGNPEKLFLMGHSAGAHLAVMLSVNPQYLANVGLVRKDIQGTIGLAGPYDFLPLTSDRLKAIFAPPSEEWRSQPICFVDGLNTPLLLMVGMKDNTVWPRNSIRLASAITAKGGQVILLTYSNYDHIDMVAKLAKPLRGNSTLLSDIADWVHRHGG